MTSISGSAVAAAPPILLDLNLYGAGARRLDKDLTTHRKDERARQLETKRKAQHELELLAIEYARVMLERHIYAALDPATDPALAAKLRNDVMNRGVGKVREVEDDENAKKKGGDGAGLLELLAAISTAASAIERTPPSSAPRQIRDIGGSGTDGDFEKLMNDIDADDEVDDE